MNSREENLKGRTTLWKSILKEVDLNGGLTGRRGNQLAQLANFVLSLAQLSPSFCSGFVNLLIHSCLRLQYFSRTTTSWYSDSGSLMLQQQVNSFSGKISLKYLAKYHTKFKLLMVFFQVLLEMSQKFLACFCIQFLH